VNNLYWIYIDYLIRMSTKKFKLTDADLNDSEDEFLPDFAGGPNNNTNNNDTVTTVEEVDNAQKEEVDNAQKEGEIDAKEQEVNAQQQEIDAKEQEIDAKEQEIDAKEQEVNAQQQEIDAQKEVVNARKEVVNAQQQINNYINDNTYINTHMPGVLDGDNDLLYITLTSPDNNTTFYDAKHDPTNETQKKLIPYIFLFAKTYRKIMNDFEDINLLISNNTDQLISNNTDQLISNNTDQLISNNTDQLISNNTDQLISNNTDQEAAAKDIREKLDTLQGQLEVFYEFPLQYRGVSLLSSNLNIYFANKPIVLIVGDKIEIFFQPDDDGQKTWADFTKEIIDGKVSFFYNEGDIQFDTKPNAQARLKTFENERLTNTGKKSMMSSVDSFFRGKKGGNKKQTRRPAIHKKRNTRRK